MGQKPMRATLPAEAACGDAVIGMCRDESVLILIKHCRDMKQQETHLRFITLLLLLSCTALFIFTIGADLRRREDSRSSGQGSTVEQYAAYSRQEILCSADNPQTSFQKLLIHLRSVDTNKTGKQYVDWDIVFGDKYNKERRAIVIPKTGIYFIYMRITLNCQDEVGAGNFKNFYLALHNWNEGYNQTMRLTEAWDVCSSEGLRSVFVGQLFDLLQGDHVSAWIGEGYTLIMKSSFGAYLA